MRLLLDTHVALWAASEPERLTASIAEIVADQSNSAFVSIVSIWEIAVKRSLGRGRTTMPLSAADALLDFVALDFEILGMTPAHAIAAETLPALHRDPFDRLIVSQALTEPMRLITHDATLARYSDSVILF